MIKHLFDTVEEFIRSYFDKILLVGIFMFLIELGAEYKDMANTVLGAIIMLTTGAIIRKVNGSKPPDVPKD